MIFYVFTPCLIFVKIGDGITVDQLYKTWPLLAFPIAYAALSALLGFAALKICAPPLPLSCLVFSVSKDTHRAQFSVYE